MATIKFECPECDNEGKISFKPVESRFETEVSFCPFCGADISENETPEEDE